MAEKITLTCDQVASGRVCGKDAHTYTMHGPKGSWSIDLCDKHADPMYEGVFVRLGRLSGRDQPARRTLADAARPFMEDR